ncbi:uncharacterized protein FFE2_16043 [Fusarium fujikuroi]|nr:uncharacterized protein FFE2_16043 [Fusarium fujikuroi]
MARDKEKNL